MPFADAKLPGLKGEPLEKVLKEVNAIAADAAAYGGELKKEATQAIGYQLKRVEKKQSDAFFAAYLAEAQKQLAAYGGFPLVRDVSRTTTAEKFAAAGRQLKYISDDLASPIFQKFALRDRPEWNAFIISVQSQHDVSKALLGEEATLGSCTVSLAGMSEGTKSKDEWREHWKDIKLVCEGCVSETGVRTQFEGDQKLGDVPIEKKFELRLIENANEPKTSKTFPIPVADCGPLWLIHKYNGERDKRDAEGKTWSVEFPIAPPGASGSLRLKLKFERRLPELDKWAAR